jgi:hypothetical protein
MAKRGRGWLILAVMGTMTIAAGLVLWRAYLPGRSCELARTAESWRIAL